MAHFCQGEGLGQGSTRRLPQSFVQPRMGRDGGSMATAGEGMHYEVLVERDIKVAMRDGIKLACDVYRPESPVPLSRTSGSPRIVQIPILPPSCSMSIRRARIIPTVTP